VVAPIFEHGEGRGATGCVAVSPPEFLSEDEAMQVIREELAKQKIELRAGSTLKDVKIAPRITRQFGETKPDQVVKVTQKAAPLNLDGFDVLRRVAVEFISSGDYDKLGGVDPYAGSTVSTYDFKDAAKYLAGEVQKQERKRIYVGVFYDPAVPADWKNRQKGKDQSEALLRQQAKEFVAWLKKQGAL
jgi:hypothetical protein